MKLSPSDPDLRSIITRLQNAEINLQPEFQRGEVWGNPKKRRLIDTILRGWHVPPVHLIVGEEVGLYEVLDGQQRLTAVRDFANGEIRIDGSTEPPDEEIEKLDGLTYQELPEPDRRRFDLYTLRTLAVSDYSPEEPGELFYRLNQPTNLTAAEQRNAFFGPARQQVKKIVGQFSKWGLTRESLGFSNSRMAYDDVVARACYSLDQGTLAQKVTASLTTSRYRSSEAFSGSSVRRCRAAAQALGDALYELDPPPRLNKATFLTWLCWLADLRTNSVGDVSTSVLSQFLEGFEATRTSVRQAASDGDTVPRWPPRANPTAVRNLLGIFNDRASSRVADVSSVLTRHTTLWVCFTLFAADSRSTRSAAPGIAERLAAIVGAMQKRTSRPSLERLLEDIATEDWAEL